MAMKLYRLLLVCLLPLQLVAQSNDFSGLRALGSPHNPKVVVAWNRYYDYAGITDICQRIAKAYPNLARVSSIGKSTQGREMWMLTITDFGQGGNPDRKPGFYIDGNIHSNEIQGTEISLYTAWYLVENQAYVPFIRDLLRDRVFYIVPTINPDARENFLYAANTANSPRSGMMALDDDGDGYADEDKMDDLDGDGHITQMRRRSPNGRWKADPENPRRLIPAKADEAGEYELLGNEGIDNDGDGQVNEDGHGYYDPNRDWGWNWQPDYIQNGAYRYPFSLPEIRAVRDFVMSHPNIAGAQSYHNYGGMFLRGPGAEDDQFSFPAADVRVYDLIGQTGEKMIPGYRYLTTYKDLYTVFGGEIDWMHSSRGIFAFTNELMNSYLLFHRKSEEGRFQNNDFYEADRLLLFGDAFVEWKKFDHPQYGQIEIGGFKKNHVRNHPGFLLEEDAHRNMAFTLFHAHQMPKLEVQEVQTKSLPGGLTEITATIANLRPIPTHSAHDVRYKIERPDYISLKGVTPLTGIILENADLNVGREQKNNPATLEVPVIPGMGAVKVRWLIKGKPGSYTIEIDSRKGGLVSKTF